MPRLRPHSRALAAATLVAIATIPVAAGDPAGVGGPEHAAAIGQRATPSPMRGAPFRTCTLYDNGLPDLQGTFAYSNAIEEVLGARRTLLDDIVVPDGETWTLERLEWYNVWTFYVPPGTGSGVELSLRTDAAVAPGQPLQLLTPVNYSEYPTGEYFGDGLWQAASIVEIEPVVLPAGRYWFEGTIVGLANNFWYTADQRNEECWVNYEDLGGLRPGSLQFGTPKDLSWCLGGASETVGFGACCLPSGSCLILSYLECTSQGGLHQGDGTGCVLQVCSATGACCFPDGACVAQSENFCDHEGGVYGGVGSECSTVECVDELRCRVDFRFELGTRGSDPGQFKQPGGVDIDASRIYVADTWNHRVQVFDRDGNFEFEFGSFGTGDGEFRYPRDVAVSPGGGIFVADALNERIQVFDRDGNFVRWFCGENQCNAAYVAADDFGRVYVGSYFERIRVFSTTGVPLLVIDGVNALDVAVDADRIYATNSWFFGPKIDVYDRTNGDFLFRFGTEGTGEGEFTAPSAVAVDDDGLIYVGDPIDRVQVFDAAGQFQYGFGRTGARPGAFSGIRRLAIDGGRLVAADRHNDRIQVFDLVRADLDGSGAVDFGDILRILGAWGMTGVPEDLDGSGTVDFGDLLVVLGAWGPCP